MKVKYIKLKSGEVILFPAILEHDSLVSYIQIQSAGFCNIETDKISCYGESHSLKMKADEKQDTFDATKQFIGIEAALKLL